MMLSWEVTLLRLSLAAVLGAIIGLERERKNWSAGLRTHMMVCVGSTLILLVSSYGFFEVIKNDDVVLDPSRVAAQVVSGIGFLGAGTIIFLRPGLIRGLTTASGLWTVAAIGLAVGAGMYFAAIITTIIAFSILLILQPLEKKFTQVFTKKFIKIVLDSQADTNLLLNKILNHNEFEISDFQFSQTKTEITLSIYFENFDFKRVIQQLLIFKKEENLGIKKIYWNK